MGALKVRAHWLAAHLTVADVRSSADQWRNRVERHFGFLADRGFELATLDDSSFWETWVEYRSDLAAVRVSRSNEFVRVIVSLIRLVDGAVPPYPVWITAERIDWTWLDNVLAARNPEQLDQTQAMNGLDDDALDRQLEFWSAVLREVASDFLGGDLSAIDEAGEVVRERVRQHPQKVVAWLPAGASSDREARTIQELSQTIPPEVGVVSHRYQPRRKPGR